MAKEAPVRDLTKNTADSHQSQPWIIVAILPFAHKDTYHLGQEGQENINNAIDINTPIVVVSDVIKCTVNDSKSSHLGSAELLLSSGDFNYQSKVAPGDHILIWMGNNMQTFETISNAVLSTRSGKRAGSDNSISANVFNSGLKFVGKVNSVREITNVAPNGIKTLRYTMTAKSFSEFDNNIYYNPLLQNADTNPLRLLAQISEEWQDLYATDTAVKVGRIIEFLISIFIGKGPSEDFRQENNVLRSPNLRLAVPNALPALLGQNLKEKEKFSYADILQQMIGIQKYRGGTRDILPIITSETRSSNQKNTPDELYGQVLDPPDSFNNIKLWSLLQNYMNRSLNEIYTTLKPDHKGRIMPTFVARQIPFTSEFFIRGDNQRNQEDDRNDIKFTRFLNLPRWKVDESLRIGSSNLGTSDSLRFNFTQTYGQILDLQGESNQSLLLQISQGNFDIDKLDVMRTGNRSMITTSNADVAASGEDNTFSDINIWNKLIADWWINAHLKLSGSVQFAGIQEPIAVGDNLEYNGRLLHIETLSHFYEVVDGAPNFKVFYTTVGVSNGVRVDGSYITSGPENRENLTSDLYPGYNDEERWINDIPIWNTKRNAQNDGDNN